jgi:hypothetical protein
MPTPALGLGLQSLSSLAVLSVPSGACRPVCRFDPALKGMLTDPSTHATGLSRHSSVSHLCVAFLDSATSSTYMYNMYMHMYMYM